MKVSVVIPAYNEAANIAKAIEAVMAQDYNDFEIIVVNNASTDDTAEIVANFPVRLVHEPQKGLLYARERGRLEATGDIIANMDADCLPSPDWISKGVSGFTSDSIVAVTGPYDYFDGHPFFRHGSLLTQKYIYSMMSLFLQSGLVRRGAILTGGNNMIRSTVLSKAGGYTTSIVFYGEDTDTARKISCFGRVLFDPNFTIRSSARRFKAEGTIHLMFKYWYYFFKHILK